MALAHLMSHDERETVFGLRVGQQTRVYCDLAAGKGKGVGCLVIVDHGEFPFVVGFIGRGCDPGSDPLDHGVDLGVLGDLFLRKNLLVGLDSQRDLLLLGHEEQL